MVGAQQVSWPEAARGGLGAPRTLLAPAWQAHDLRVDEPDRVSYRPTQEEILEYIQSLPQHPNIRTMTSTTFCYSEKKSVPTGVEGEDPINKHHAVCEGIIASVRAIVHCTGWSEVTAGKKYLPLMRQKSRMAL